MDFLLWSDALLYPRDTFRAEAEYASLGRAIKNVLAAGLIYGAITGFFYDIFPEVNGLFFPRLLRELLKGSSLISNIFLSPLVFLLLFFLSSLIFFIAARIFEGYGDFKTQTYLLSSLAAPLILSGLLDLIPVIGRIMMLLLFIYTLWPLTLALRETHKYSKRATILTLSLSGVIFLALLSGLITLLLKTGFSVGSWGNIEKNNQGFKNIKLINAGTRYHRSGGLEVELVNTLNYPIIITDLISGGDCQSGEVDLNKKTLKKESFTILPPDDVTQIKITNCKEKFLLRDLIGSKFFVPLEFKYQEKHIGKGVIHQERGFVKGMVE